MDPLNTLSASGTNLAPFDSIDLAAGVGALQLVPENAGRLYSLEIAASLIAELEPLPGRPVMSSPRWRRLLDGPDAKLAVGMTFEAPYENSFVDEVVFDGASYRFLPGLEDEAIHTIRALTNAVLAMGQMQPTRKYASQARTLCHSALAVSDLVCRRAELNRGCLPGQGVGGAVVVPSGERFTALKRAVTFPTEDLSDLLRSIGADLDDLAPLVAYQGQVPIALSPMNFLPHITMPIVRDQQRFVVIGPQAIVARLRHALIRLAMDMGLVDELAAAYRSEGLDTIRRSLKLLDSLPVGVPSSEENALAGDTVVSEFFTIDSDKVLHALFVSDDLQAYSVSDPLGTWPTDALSEVIAQRLEFVERLLLGSRPAPVGILHCVLIQGIGRHFRAFVSGSGLFSASDLLTMTVGDLSTIANLEAGSKLRLWQFARANNRLRQTTSVFHQSMLDQYEYWRSKGYSYYPTDDLPRNFLSIEAGGAGRLRREVQRTRDFHGVSHPHTDAIVEVARVSDDHRQPIYFPLRKINRYEQLLAELSSGTFWITSVDEIKDSRYGRLYSEIAEMLAYWLWQLDEGLIELALFKPSRDAPINIQIELEPDPLWLGGSGAAVLEPAFRTDVRDDAKLVFWFGPGTVQLLESTDNDGERQILRVLLRKFEELATLRGNSIGALLSSDCIENLLARFAPLGLKKKLFFVRSFGNPLLDDTNLPQFRTVQEFDEEELLDSVGSFAKNALGLDTGPIPRDQRTTLINTIVDFLFGELKNLIAQHSPEDLLESLISAHEAVLTHQKRRAITISSQLACFCGETFAEKLGRDLADASAAATASRVLLEYCTAQPPQGTDQLSQSAYDRMLALVSEIQEWAFLSDQIRYGLADHTLEMLPTDRIGIHRQKFLEAREMFWAAYVEGEVDRQVVEFRQDQARVDPSTDDELETATRAEFRLPQSALLNFLMALIGVHAQTDSAAKTELYHDLTAKLASALEWREDDVRTALAQFSAYPRESFIKPPPPFSQRDVLPWNFSRRLSYLHKPLLVRKYGVADHVLWGDRSVYLAALNLRELCSSPRFEANSPEMKRLIGKRRNTSADEFNDRVAVVFNQVTAHVNVRVKKIGKSRIQRPNGQDLGDIDVLVALPTLRKLLAIETKDLAIARTPAELGHEIESVFGTASRRSSAVDKHLERTNWLRDHLIEVLDTFSLPNHDVGRWVVEPMLVTNLESLGPHLVRQRLRVESIQQLKRELNQSTT